MFFILIKRFLFLLLLCCELGVSNGLSKNTGLVNKVFIMLLELIVNQCFGVVLFLKKIQTLVCLFCFICLFVAVCFSFSFIILFFHIQGKFELLDSSVGMLTS